MIFFYQILLGFSCSLIVSFFAYFLKLLTRSGIVAATLCGTLIISCGPWYSILLVGLFFVSSALIHLGKKIRPQQQDVTEKGHQRDAAQVLANLGAATLSLVGFKISGQVFFLFGFIAGIASGTADTWASEIGVLSKRPPRSILTGRPLVPGLSGGVSMLGSLAALIGSSLIVLSSTVFQQLPNHPPQKWQILALLILIGFGGSFLDSFLGAAFQVRYQCQVCGILTEQTYHHQKATKKVHGIRWMNNDVVNFLSTSGMVVITWWVVK